jgi:hypothetical protein
MTPFEGFLDFLFGSWRLDIFILGKIGVLLFLVLYLIFALVVVKQVKLMSRTITASTEPYLLTGAWVLVGLALAVLLLGLIIL